MDDELQTTVISAGNDNNSSMSSSGPASPPLMPLNSPGSSVSMSSSKLKEEYSQLLKYTLDTAPGLGALLSSLQGSVADFTSATGRESSRSSIHRFLNGSQDPVDVEEVIVLDDDNKDNNKNNARRNKGNNASSDNSSNTCEAAINSMSSKLSSWMEELKGNILEEMTTAFKSSLQIQTNELKKANNRILLEKKTLQKEVNNLTARVDELECSLRQKNTLVKNMTDNIYSQKKKLNQAKFFYTWKTECNDKDRECFTQKLAYEHFSKKLALRVLKAWYSLIQSKWRNRVERQCQTQAKSMCMNLSSDYEIKVCMLNEKIQSLEEKVCLLQQEREMYSDQVKKAFMRGMCALNVETMSILTEDGCPDQPRSMPPEYDDDSPATVTYSNTQPVTNGTSNKFHTASSQTGLRTISSVPGMSSQGTPRNGYPLDTTVEESQKSSQPSARNNYSANRRHIDSNSTQGGLRNDYLAAIKPKGQGGGVRKSCSVSGDLDPSQLSQNGLRVACSADTSQEPNYSSRSGLGMTCSASGPPGQPISCMLLDSEMQTSTTALLDTQTSTIGLERPPSKGKKSPKGKKGKGKGKGGKNKTHNASVVLDPPMASVIVERHQAINKQTLGKATAARYPKKSKDDMVNEVVKGKSLSGSFQPIAGQTGIVGKPPTSNSMCIRVVE